MDVPGPLRSPSRPPFPHLRVLHTGDGRLVASACPHDRGGPRTAEALLRRDRHDLVLVDAVDGWSPTGMDDVRSAARRSGTPVVAVGEDAAHLVGDPDLVVVSGPPVAADPAPVSGRPVLRLPPAVDVTLWSPAGLKDAGPGERRDDPEQLTPSDARRQPVVVVPALTAPQRSRCLELLAAGALVVTGPDPGLRELLGPHADLVTGPAGSVDERAKALLADADLRRRHSVRLRRHVHQHHATWRRLLAIVERLGIDDPPDERISILLPTRRPERLGQVTRDLAAQTHPARELILLPHGDGRVPDDVVGVDRIERVPVERPLGAVLNVGLDLARGRYVAKVDDDDRYGSDHLRDQLLGLGHSRADLVGKRVHGVYREDEDVTLHPLPGGEEQWEDHLPGGTLLLPTEVMRSVRWRHVPHGVDTELVRAIHLGGGSCYSTHRYGYVRVRHADHTYDPEAGWSGEPHPGFDPSLLEA